MNSQSIQFSKSEFLFNHPWETVVKGFLQKYPHKDLSFVKSNNIIDMQLINDNCLNINRLVYSKF